MVQLPITFKRRVAWDDVDASGAWHFTAALRYVEEAETLLMREAGILQQTASFPRIYVDAHFKRPAGFDDEVVVHLGVLRLGTSSVHYEFVIANAGDIAVEGRLGVAFVGRSGAAERLPDTIRAALTAIGPD